MRITAIKHFHALIFKTARYNNDNKIGFEQTITRYLYTFQIYCMYTHTAARAQILKTVFL